MQSAPGVPDLSYVLAAADAGEVHAALSWLRNHPVSARIEVVLAAPAAALSFVAAALVPPGLVLASAINPANRTEVRRAGAQSTTGAVVIVIDCDDDFEARIRDPFAAGSPESEADWAAGLTGDAVLPPVPESIVGTIPAV